LDYKCIYSTIESFDNIGVLLALPGKQLAFLADEWLAELGKLFLLEHLDRHLFPLLVLLLPLDEVFMELICRSDFLESRFDCDVATLAIDLGLEGALFKALGFKLLFGPCALVDNQRLVLEQPVAHIRHGPCLGTWHRAQPRGRKQHLLVLVVEGSTGAGLLEGFWDLVE
jgi:hypothetical protein